MSKVYLVGAGPGDPELLTVKADRLLRTADVILHDDLVSPEILKLSREDATVINVGKRCGVKRISQEHIHALMIFFASEDRKVVRLKSGDPLLFGRAAEEMKALENARIDYEIVPGITAALAAAASARVSLTHRRHASSVVFTTGHHCAGKEIDWQGIARPDVSLAIYMPGTDYASLVHKLIAAGLPAHTPCILISRIASPEQQSVVTTIAELLKQTPAPAPTLLLIGAAFGVLPNRVRPTIRPINYESLGGRQKDRNFHDDQMLRPR
ncbi:MAG: uroporphyrinogen-III C-methyltransferase [Bryobacteraceae bacterium]